MHNHICLYGVTNDGVEITEDTISNCDDIGFPEYYIKGHNNKCIGLMSDWLDKRRNLATIYKFCPHCGAKLNIKKLKNLAKSVDNYCF